MGNGDYDFDVPRTRSVSRETTFTHRGHANDADAARHPERKTCHPLLDPKGKIRECMDSDEHPDSFPIVNIMDVTLSRGDDAVVVFRDMPHFIGQVRTSGYILHPVLCTAAVGDATSGDQAPIQVSQFESDERIDEALSKLWLEEGGGGTGQESYELLAYYFARKVVLDANKRGKKGLLFFHGDEGFYPQVLRDQVKVWIGDDISSDIPSEQIFAELQENFDVYLIYPRKSWEERIVDIDKEIAGRVRNAGGMVEGVSIRASLIWDNTNDLDLHAIGPHGDHIYFRNYCRSNQGDLSPSGGYLDVDMNVRGETPKPAENIRWEKGKAPKGHYNFYVQNYATHGNPAKTPFRVEVEIDGKVLHFEGTTPEHKTGDLSNTPVYEFDYDPEKGLVTTDPHEAYKDEVVLGQWGSVLPQGHILSIQDPASCTNVKLGVIALTQGGKSLDEFLNDMELWGQDATMIQDVSTALKFLAEVGISASISSSPFDQVAKRSRL